MTPDRVLAALVATVLVAAVAVTGVLVHVIRWAVTPL